jgi:hypothetical protein
MTSCKKGLDFTNTNTINPNDIWGNQTLIKSFLTDIYGSSMPGWNFDGNNSDEGISGTKTLGNYIRGIITVDNTAVSLNYSVIDKCNFFIDQASAAPASVLSDPLKAQYIAEAKFWRAWSYWNMVSKLGGVPLILHTQNSADVAGLKVPRSKTSACIAQIVTDLDSAALVLPAAYTGADFGRITKIAALGLKGRILLWYASPLFNPGNDPARWQTAYVATKAAVDAATANGYGLDPKFGDIWYNQNKEMIMVNQYYYPDHYMNFAPIRVIPFTNGSTGSNQPIWSLLTAFPKRDGSPMQANAAQLSDPDYNTQFLTDFYTNRDDRFYTTVYCGGTPYPTPDIIGGQPGKASFWDAWSSYTATSKVNIAPLVTPGISYNGLEGFYDRKGLDTSLTGAQVVGGAAGAKSYWVPMRFGELLMNYGECANETGNTGAALNVLYQIRARAHILPGKGQYGITAASTADIRTAYINERQVEFAFENMRINDLRRWRRYDIINSQGGRHGLVIVLKPGQPLPAPSDNIMTNPTVRSKFSAQYVDNLDGDPSYVFNLDLNHWFYPLSLAQMTLEPANLPQNKEWGGTFDPLQ